MNNLIFDSDAHTYSVNGVKYASVTQIISPFGEDSDTNEFLELAFEVAAERGVVLHEIIALLLDGNCIEDIEYPDPYSGYVDAILSFLSEHDILPFAIEESICAHDLTVAGTPDLLCEFDGILSIVDYKFVSQLTGKMKTKYKAQLNGYRELYTRQGVYPQKLYVVQFLSSGKYRLYPVSVDPSEFELCLKLYNLSKKKHPRGEIT